MFTAQTKQTTDEAEIRL